MRDVTDNTALLEKRLKRYSAAAGAVAGGIGLFHLAAWCCGVMTYRGLQSITMKTNAALCLTLCGGALALLFIERGRGSVRRLASCFAGAALAIAFLTLLEHVTGWDFGIDQLLAREARGGLAVMHPNRMGPPAAFSFTLAGIALLLLSDGSERRWHSAQRIALVVGLIPLLGLLGYLYGAQGFYGMAQLTGIALPTALGLLLLATGLLAARPQAGLMANLIAADPGGEAIRRLLPAAFLLPVLLGGLWLQGERLGLYDRHVGNCLMVLSWITIFSFLIYKTGNWLSGCARATRLSEEKFSKAFASSPAAMAITTLEEGRYVEVNESWQVMFGCRRDEVLGRRSREFGFWPTMEDRQRAVQELRSRGAVRNLELVLLNRSGERTVTLTSGELLTLGGELVGLWSHVDITDRKRAEEELRRTKDELEMRVLERTQELEQTHLKLQRQSEERLVTLQELRKNEQLLIQQSRLAAMGEMLGNIAHQWRQPLNNLGLVLQGLSLNYKMGQFSADMLHSTVEKSMRLISHMSQTIEDFSGFLQPDRATRPFSVNQAVAAALELFEATLETMQVDLQVRQSGELVVDGHRNEFTQVILNLITNARDAYRERGVTAPRLVIELGQVDGRPVVTITDNAGGVPEEIMDRIFDPYFTTKGPDRGTGIGLFMSKNIIEKSMNGSLTVRNTEEGAEFRIEL